FVRIGGCCRLERKLGAERRRWLERCYRQRRRRGLRGVAGLWRFGDGRFVRGRRGRCWGERRGRQRLWLSARYVAPVAPERGILGHLAAVRLGRRTTRARKN